MAVIDQKLDAWKNKLLDLGKRNRLINYRDTKRSNLCIKKPTIFELWNSFVEHEIPLEFPYYDDDQISLLETESSETKEELNSFKQVASSEFDTPFKSSYNDADQTSVCDRLGTTLDASIITNQTVKEQQKTLRNLREKAKTVMEEQGVNILYLS